MRAPNRSDLTRILLIIKSKKLKRLKIDDYSKLVEHHFSSWSEINHPSKAGLAIALSNLNDLPANILETGTSAWGCDSSRLFDSYVRIFGGKFVSIDLRAEASNWLRFQVSRFSSFFVGDSVKFLINDFPKLEMNRIDLCYLDSFDIDWHNSISSAEHGYAEFVAVRAFLKKGSILIIDDTPNNLDKIPIGAHKHAEEFFSEFGVLPGKGSLVHKEILKNGDAEVLHHSWNVVYRFL